MTSHQGHRRRLWERFQNQGLRGFYQAYEKLEFLLTFTQPRKDTKPLAKQLLARFGSLNAVVTAPRVQLIKVAGVGERTAGFLKLIGEMALALEEERLDERDLLARPEQVKSFLKRELAWEEAEHFWVLFLDMSNRLLKKQRMFRGTLNRNVVFPREIIKEGLACNAAAVIVAHNHPSGQTLPSKEDIRLTKILARSLKTVGMILHDHLIVGKQEVNSLREAGFFQP